MHKQNDVFQLPRHTATVQKLVNANKIGKTTVVFARSLDGVNTGVEKLSVGFINFVDKQMELGPGKLPQVTISFTSSFTKFISQCKRLVVEEISYLLKDFQTFLKRY